MKNELTKEEINRKLLHGLAVVLPVGIFYGPDLFNVSRVFACFLIGFLFATSLAIEIMRLNHRAFGGWFHRFFWFDDAGKGIQSNDRCDLCVGRFRSL